LQRENKICKVRDVDVNLKGKVVFFATSNIHKFNEVRVLLSQYGIAAGMLNLKGVEIQSDQLQEIASTSVLTAYNKCHLPLIVEDAGLFIDALNGFPGPYAAYAYKTLSNAGMLKLLENVKNRKASFKSAIAYCGNESGKITCFEGEATGEISQQEHAKNAASAFGFDPIFIPVGSKKTFAQMSIEEKNVFSHRAMAVVKFAKWYQLQK
jgi:XTP/dITP diphosphohydrolase